jgi:hypothetical protein
MDRRYPRATSTARDPCASTDAGSHKVRSSREPLLWRQWVTLAWATER